MGRDNAVASRQTCQLERGLIGLGAGIAEHNPGVISVPASELNELLAQCQRWLRGENVGHVPHRGNLLGHSFHDGRMCVTQRVDCNTGEQIQVFLALGIRDNSALTLHKLNARRAVIVHHRVLPLLLEVAHVVFRPA